MKRLLGLLITCLALTPLFAQPDTSLEQPEELYRQGKFAAALSGYEALLKNYPNNPFVYYNIGNCYFKMGSRGLATANYYRAFKLLPRDKDIRHNLALSLETSGEKWIPSGVPEVLHEAFFYVSQDELKGLVYISFWAVCLLVTVCIWRRKWNGLATSVCLIFLVSGLWLYARLRLEPGRCCLARSRNTQWPGDEFPGQC